jgi:endonuclease-3
LPPVDELILCLLAQRTDADDNWRGYQALLTRFTCWDALADAPLAQVAAALHSCGLSRQRAARIQAILQRVRAEQGAITLDFLSALPPDEALAYLISFTGVGRQTASRVLLFALDMPALPVNTHVLRVSRRLALLPDGTHADAAHAMLESLLPEELYRPFHDNTFAHGRQTCTAQRPACARCPLCADCAFGQQQLAAGGSARNTE